MFPNLKNRKKTQFENKAKHQLETTLLIRNIKERKNVNVIGKDQVSSVTRKQSLTKEIVFRKDCRF